RLASRKTQEVVELGGVRLAEAMLKVRMAGRLEGGPVGFDRMRGRQLVHSHAEGLFRAEDLYPDVVARWIAPRAADHAQPAARKPASNRRWKPTWSTPPAAATRATTRRVESRSSASGFSVNAGKLRSRQRSMISACVPDGVTMTAASTPSSAWSTLLAEDASS